MASGAYQSPVVTGTGNSSNTSLENPVLSWGHAQHHDKFPYIRCFHWAQTTCLRFAPVCTKLGRSASAGDKVRRVTHSHHPKATRLTMEKSHLSWCLLPCSLYHCITTAPACVWFLPRTKRECSQHTATLLAHCAWPLLFPMRSGYY